MKNFFLKILIGFLAAAVLFGGLTFSRTVNAEHVTASIISDPFTTALKVWEQTDKQLDKVLMALRDAVVKRLVDLMTDQIITWVQGGGEPQFVTNWQGFLKNAANAAVGDVVLQTNAAFLCSPFKLQVQLSLLQAPIFSQRVECTLDDIVANIDDFYNDFEKGGWIAYNEVWQPQGNYYGEMLMIHDEMITRGALAKEAAQNEALAGKGFLSVKRCKGGGISADEKNQMEEYGGPSGYVKDYKGNYCPPDQTENITPGDVVGETVAKAIGAQTDWVVNVQSIISAIANAIINRLTKEGLSLMKGSSEGDIDYDIAATTYYPEISQQYDKDKKNMIGQIQTFTKEWQYLLDAKNRSLSYAQQLKGVLEQLKQNNCEPLVTSQQIQNAQDEIDRLTNEISVLQVKLDEANKIIDQINKADFFDIHQRSLAQTAYQDFMAKYSTDEQITQIVDGSARQAADAEGQNKQNELTNAQNQLTICLASSNQP